MPNTTSAKKRLRQSLEQRARNRAGRSALKSFVRRVLAAITARDLKKAEEEFRLTAIMLDKSGARGLIHPNKAGRIKSRLQKRLKTAKQT
jgi:small subunit ribosomal protein S20